VIRRIQVADTISMETAKASFSHYPYQTSRARTGEKDPRSLSKAGRFLASVIQGYTWRWKWRIAGFTVTAIDIDSTKVESLREAFRLSPTCQNEELNSAVVGGNSSSYTIVRSYGIVGRNQHLCFPRRAVQPETPISPTC
jgi:hypothetical protein